jgi:hypothetical protein
VVIAPVPPLVVSTTLLVPPLHEIGVATAVMVNDDGCVMVIVLVFVQPFASVAVYVYVPATLLIVPGAVVMDPVPPAVVKVTLLVPPLHSIADAVALMVMAVGCVIFSSTVLVHPLASVAVNV